MKRYNFNLSIEWKGFDVHLLEFYPSFGQLLPLFHLWYA
jgi:hypothetical protein